MGADFSFGLDGKSEIPQYRCRLHILDLEMRSENISISFSFHPLGNLFRPFSFHQKKKTMKLFLMTVTFSFSSFCPSHRDVYNTPPQWLPLAFYCFCPFPDFPSRSYILGNDFLDPIISISLPPCSVFCFVLPVPVPTEADDGAILFFFAHSHRSSFSSLYTKDFWRY